MWAWLTKTHPFQIFSILFAVGLVTTAGAVGGRSSVRGALRLLTPPDELSTRWDEDNGLIDALALSAAEKRELQDGILNLRYDRKYAFASMHTVQILPLQAQAKLSAHNGMLQPLSLGGFVL